MTEMKLKIEKDTNEVKYISILRKNTNMSISEIKELFNNNDFVLSYNLLKIDEMLEMKKLVSMLLDDGAKVHIFEENREVSIEFLDNLIHSYLESERYLEDIDEQMFYED